MVICLERGADLHMAQLMPLPLTVSCFSKIQIGFNFLVSAHQGSSGQRAVKRVRVSVRSVCAGSIECRADHFSCGAAQPCIPWTWRCDGHVDCTNRNDESAEICESD